MICTRGDWITYIIHGGRTENHKETTKRQKIIEHHRTDMSCMTTE